MQGYPRRMHREGLSWQAGPTISSPCLAGRLGLKLALVSDRVSVVEGFVAAECATWACLRDLRGLAEESGLAPYSELGAHQSDVLDHQEHQHSFLCGHLASPVHHRERFIFQNLEMAGLFRRN